MYLMIAGEQDGVPTGIAIAALDRWPVSIVLAKPVFDQRDQRSMTGPNYPLDADGVWCQVFSHGRRGGPALFLDRDGVVVEEVNYLHRVEDIAICPDAAAVVAAANASAVTVVLVTNQAGIGRGYYGWAEFRAVQEAIERAIADQGGHFNAVYACPHHRDGKGAFAHPDHPARKPNPGMLHRAAKALDIDMARSWLAGDRASDIEAAKRAGLAGAMHVLTGYGQAERTASMAFAGPGFDVRVAVSIAGALALPLFDGDRASRGQLS